MSHQPRNTYRYYYKMGDKVVHAGITSDPARREADYQRAKPGGRLVRVGRKVTRESAIKWEREQLQDVASRGRAIYREKIRPLVYPQEKGNLVAVDIHTGDYEVDADELTVIGRLQERRPDAAIWVERVGYQAVHSVGGTLLPDLADGGELACKVYSLNALWHEEARRVSVHEMGDKPLIGMRLLTGSRVTLDVVDGGPVTIEPLMAP